jgi:tRNA(His) 5'-end guanylyltransferase
LILKGNLSNQEAEARLRPTDSAAKNELLFKEFNMNYNNVHVRFRKGSVVFRDSKGWRVDHLDIIGESFWREHFPKMTRSTVE